MKYKMVEPTLTFHEQQIDAAATIVRSDDDWASSEVVQRFSLSIGKTTSAVEIANAMGVYALQIAVHDREVVQVTLDVEALLASAAYEVEL